MPEDKVETEIKKNKTQNKFQAKCFKCKNKGKATAKNGMTYNLPFAYVPIKKDKELLKECKAYVKESLEKYGKDNVIKRKIIHGCPICHNDIVINCKDYVEFYKPKTKKQNKNTK